jgi:hypothetical protein
MKKLILCSLFAAVASFASPVKAQTTAMDFNILDCNGTQHHLYSDLDAGKAVIIEFFMNSCSPCVTAGQALESMKADLLSEYPGMVKAYTFAFNNSYSCTIVNNWVTNNGFTSVPSDSGAAQVAYYGGMGMPTIVILGGGTNHSVLGSPYIGFSTSDTTTMAADIRAFLGGTSINDNLAANGLNVYPNPANTEMNISFTLEETSDVTIELVDVAGRVVATVLREKAMSGAITRTINTTAIAQGNYVIRINANGKISQQKLNVIH